MCYNKSTEKVTFEEASERCSSFKNGAKLAEPRDNASGQFVKEMQKEDSGERACNSNCC